VLTVSSAMANTNSPANIDAVSEILQPVIHGHNQQ